MTDYLDVLMGALAAISVICLFKVIVEALQ